MYRRTRTAAAAPIRRRPVTGLLSRVRLAAVAALVVGLIFGLAAPASAAPLGCEVTVVDVTAINIQEDDQDEADGVDEIWVRVGAKWFPSFFNSIVFVPGQTRSASELQDPKNTRAGNFVNIEIVEDDAWPDANDSLGVQEAICSSGGPGFHTLFIQGQGTGAQYRVNYFSRIVL